MDARELGLRREIDAIARGRDQMIEAKPLAADSAGHLAVAGERDVGQRAVQVHVEALERHGALDRIERHGRDAAIAEQEIAPAHDVGQLVAQLEHVAVAAIERAAAGLRAGWRRAG